MKKIIYLTTNKHKVEEMERFVENNNYSFGIDILDPDFEVVEIQAKDSIEVARFSAEYAANKLEKAVLKSDTSLYIDVLGGLPGPYNAYFDKQIGTEKFLELLKGERNRKARLEHTFAYCAPGSKPQVFSGGSRGSLSYKSRGERGRWHDHFFIPEGESETLSELRDRDEVYESQFYGTALKDFCDWFDSNDK